MVLVRFAQGEKVTDLAFEIVERPDHAPDSLLGGGLKLLLRQCARRVIGHDPGEGSDFLFRLPDGRGHGLQVVFQGSNRLDIGGGALEPLDGFQNGLGIRVWGAGGAFFL